MSQLSKYDFSFKEPKKTAKTCLFNVGKCALKACHPEETISFLGFSYNIVDKLREEIGKLDDETARKALQSIKDELASFS